MAKRIFQLLYSYFDRGWLTGDSGGLQLHLSPNVTPNHTISATFIASPPTSVSTVIASPITYSGAAWNSNLSNLSNSNNVSISFDRGPTNAYGYTPLSQPLTAQGVFSASISGLGFNITFYYRAKVIGKDTNYGLDSAFTTLPTSIPSWDIIGDGVCNISDVVSLGFHRNKAGTPGYIRGEASQYNHFLPTITYKIEEITLRFDFRDRLSAQAPHPRKLVSLIYEIELIVKCH